MTVFCIIKDSDKKFDCNIDVDFQYNPIDEYKGKWVPRKIKRRKYGYVTYRVINGSQHFLDSKTANRN